MLRIWTAIVWLAVVCSQPAHADKFVLRDANAVVAACESKDTRITDAYCFTYVVAVAEMYFLSNPSCLRPDYRQFMGAVLENIIVSTRAMNPQQLASETSVNVVYQAIAKAHPCQISERSNVLSPEACQKVFAVLSNPFTPSIEKQVLFELLRNKGCLK